MPKPCETCGTPLPTTRVNQGIERPLSPQRLLLVRFCSHRCSAQAKRQPVPKKSCAHCGGPILRLRASAVRRSKVCSPECQYATMRRPPRACGRCSQATANRTSRFCLSCQEKARRATRWSMPAEIRERFSRERRGAGNPNWQGGPSKELHRRQTAFARWGRQHRPRECEECGCTDGQMEHHHIVSKRRFLCPEFAHFQQNLAVLCVPCHRHVEGRTRRAIQEHNAQAYPFGDRLPGTILRQLVQDGLVSRLSSVCNWSPLGARPAGAPKPRMASSMLPAPGAGVRDG